MKKAKEYDTNGKAVGLWKEFKAFITRGNVLDMAVGVIVGGAFNTIVTALTSILLSICTWGVPGGLKGLITVLPAANDAQRGVSGIGQMFSNSDLAEMTIAYAKTQGATITVDSDSFPTWQSTLLGKYTAHGTNYFYNGSAIIDWGSFINAIISFLIIALTLFVIVKVVKTVKLKREALKAKAVEDYFIKHPEERPAPVVPGKPAPTEMDVLIEIREELKKQNANKAAESTK